MPTTINIETGLGPIERISGAHRSIETDHAKIHDGRGFMHDGKHPISNGDTTYHLLKNPAGNYAHLRVISGATTAAPIVITLYESPTTTADGTSGVVVNYNRASSITNNLLIFEAPTVTVVGTYLEGVLLTGSKQAGGMGIDLPTEWVLAPSTNYLIEMVNNSGSSADVYLYIFWYE